MLRLSLRYQRAHIIPFKKFNYKREYSKKTARLYISNLPRTISYTFNSYPLMFFNKRSSNQIIVFNTKKSIIRPTIMDTLSFGKIYFLIVKYLIVFSRSEYFLAIFSRPKIMNIYLNYVECRKNTSVLLSIYISLIKSGLSYNELGNEITAIERSVITTVVKL